MTAEPQVPAHRNGRSGWDDADRFRSYPDVDQQTWRRTVRAHWRPIAFWSAAAVLVGCFLAWAIFWAPDVLVKPAPTQAELDKLMGKDRASALIDYANAKNAVRTTLIGAVAGAAFLTTGFFAWRQVVVGRLGQLTDRFSNSVENLSETSPATRLGGVYTLQQLGADERFSRQVARVLLAFVRETAVEPKTDTDNDQGGEPTGRHARTGGLRINFEVQEALTILVSKRMWLQVIKTPIDLSWLFLESIRLPGGHLQRANLSHSNLSRANLRASVSRSAWIFGDDPR